MSAAFPIICVVLLGVFMFLTFYNIIGRIVAALLFTAISALFLVGVWESIGKPKPLWTEIRDLSGATIVAAVPAEGAGKIYLWVIKAGFWQTPIAYVMPWSVEKAQELQDAMREAEINNSHVEMEEGPSGDGEESLGEFEFHAAPQTPMPDKGGELPGL